MSLQGSQTTTQKGAWARTLRYLGASQAWNWPLFYFFVTITALLSLLSDAIRLENFDPLWLIVSGVSWLPTLILGVVYKRAVLNRDSSQSRPYLNFLVAGFLGSVRNLSVGFFSLITNLDPNQIWLFRAFGGFVVGTSVYLIYSNGLGSKIEYESSLKQLLASQFDLAQTRRNMAGHLADVNATLQQRTLRALRPQFESLRALLGREAQDTQALEELRNTLTNLIRPLMDEIAKEQPEPVRLSKFKDLKNVAQALPERFVLRDKIKIFWSSLIIWFSIYLWGDFLEYKNPLPASILVVFCYSATMFIFKILTPHGKNFLKRQALYRIVFYTLIAASAASVFLSLFNIRLADFILISGCIFIVALVVQVVTLQIISRVLRREEIESQLRESVNQLSKENSVFAQRVWVFRKRWLLVLHGTVQSALSAAIARLHSTPKVDEVTRQLVLQDIHRAEQAMEKNIQEPMKLSTEFEELAAVWRGICSVKTTISERAKRALEAHTDAFFCVNEVAKEAVSNAVRHGNATEVDVKIDRIQDDVLSIEITNNGSSPAFGVKPGIGSDMLDEICLHWELRTKGKQVQLNAELPFGLG